MVSVKAWFVDAGEPSVMMSAKPPCCPRVTNPGAFRAARGRLLPPSALAERVPNLASAFRCIQVWTSCKSNRNAVLTLEQSARKAKLGLWTDPAPIPR